MSIICPVCGVETENFFIHLYESINDTDHSMFIENGIFHLSDEMRDFHNFEIIDAHHNEYNLLFTDTFLFTVMPKLGYNIRKRVGQKRTIRNLKKIERSEYVNIIKSCIPYSEVVQYLDHDPEKVINFYNMPSHCHCCGKEYAETHSLQFINSRILLLSNLQMICEDCKNSKERFVAVTRTFYFAAAHHLPGYNGLCFFSHGHEWKLEVTVKKPVNPDTAMTMDFVDLKKSVNDLIINVLDHNYINDMLYNATAENLCLWIWNRLMIEGNLKGLENIKLWESPSSYADFNKEDMREIL